MTDTMKCSFAESPLGINCYKCPAGRIGQVALIYVIAAFNLPTWVNILL